MTFNYERSSLNRTMATRLDRFVERVDVTFDELEDRRSAAVERLLKERERRIRISAGMDALRAEAKQQQTKAAGR